MFTNADSGWWEGCQNLTFADKRGWEEQIGDFGRVGGLSISGLKEFIPT